MEDICFSYDHTEENGQRDMTSRESVASIISLNREAELDEIDYRTMMAEIRA